MAWEVMRKSCASHAQKSHGQFHAFWGAVGHRLPRLKQGGEGTPRREGEWLRDGAGGREAWEGMGGERVGGKKLQKISSKVMRNACAVNITP